MQIDNEPPKKPVSYYGKKTYTINPLIAKTVPPAKKNPEYCYEDIKEDKGHKT